MTTSKSASDSLWNSTSRRLPASLTTPSILPYRPSACCTMRSAACQSATRSVSADTVPPAATISATVCSAGPLLALLPSISTPRALAITRALFVDPVFDRYLHAVDEQLVGIDRLAAHLLDLAHLDLAAVQVGTKQAQALGRR